MNCDVRNKTLKTLGKKRIEWALNRMPVLEQIKKDSKSKSL